MRDVQYLYSSSTCHSALMTTLQMLSTCNPYPIPKATVGMLKLVPIPKATVGILKLVDYPDLEKTIVKVCNQTGCTNHYLHAAAATRWYVRGLNS